MCMWNEMWFHSHLYQSCAIRTFLFFFPCKCALFHCGVSLHKNSTTSWAGQMFYCGAQQLLQWLASIQMNLLQLAAASEKRRSITTRRIAAASVNDSAKQNTATCGCAIFFFPTGGQTIANRRLREGSMELGWKGANIAKLQQSCFTNKKTNAPAVPGN